MRKRKSGYYHLYQITNGNDLKKQRSEKCDILNLKTDDPEFPGCDLKVRDVKLALSGGNVFTVLGTAAYEDLPPVQARLWLRQDGRWFLGINKKHLAALKEQASEKKQS